MLRILNFQITNSDLCRLNGKRRNLLIWSMHAHNEITTLERLFMFSMNDGGDGGPLHDAAQTQQVWCLGQVFAAKLFETWLMLKERVLTGVSDQPLLDTLSAPHRESLRWLTDYFGLVNLKNCPLKILRDKTAFHYGNLDVGRAQNSMMPIEKNVYLAQHPANGLYYLGSAMVLRTIFLMIADQKAVPADAVDRAQEGVTFLIEDLQAANWNLHLLLYGLIRSLLEEAKGGTLGSPDADIKIENAPRYEDVHVPLFITVSSAAPSNATPAS